MKFRVFIIVALLSLSQNLFAEEKTEKLVAGLSHLGLTVKDLNQSTEFFVEQLGFTVGGEDKDYPANFLSNGDIFITLWQSNPEKTIEFNRKNNVGLHHLALEVTSFEALDKLYQNLKTTDGVVIEFAPELFYGGPSKHMMIREPSGNRIEFIHRASRPKESK